MVFYCLDFKYRLFQRRVGVIFVVYTDVGQLGLKLYSLCNRLKLSRMKNQTLETLIIGEGKLLIECVKLLKNKGLAPRVFTKKISDYTYLKFHKITVDYLTKNTSLVKANYCLLILDTDSVLYDNYFTYFNSVDVKIKKSCTLPINSNYKCDVSLLNKTIQNDYSIIFWIPQLQLMTKGKLVNWEKYKYSLFSNNQKNFFAYTQLLSEFIISSIFSFKNDTKSYLYYNFSEFNKFPGSYIDNLKIFKTEFVYKEIDTLKSKNSGIFKGILIHLEKYKKIVYSILLTLIIIFLPFILLLIGIGLWMIGLKGLEVNNHYLSKFTNAGYVITNTSNSLFNFYNDVPIVNSIYKKVSYIFTVSNYSNSILIKSIDIFEKSKLLHSQIFSKNDEEVDIEGLDSLILETTQVSNTLQLMLSDIKDHPNLVNLIGHSKWALLNEVASKSNSLIEIASNLPDIVGVGSARTYMIIFQNNMELRPTGGFIGSFALVSFDNGKMGDMTVYDVYSADGQLKGHVDSPYPLVKYFDHPNWYMRDANWDPNFPDTAKTLQWFLEKELSIKTDGVIAIDLETIRNILTIMPPIVLPDFNITLTKDNFYEVVERQVEEEFFPGSKQKAKLLTAFSEELKKEIIERNSTRGLILAIYKSLQEKHIQIYFNNLITNNGILNSKWGGEVKKHECGLKCISDTLMVVDSNLGVNKGNYHLDREFRLNTEVVGNKLKRDLTVILKNKLLPSITPNEWYKTYLRILIPEESIVNPISIVSDNLDALREPEEFSDNGLKEVGVWVEVKPDSTSEIKFSWHTDLNISHYDSYNLHWYKQAGTVNDSFVVRFVSPKPIITFNQPSSLTFDTLYMYNSQLTEDTNILVHW